MESQNETTSTERRACRSAAGIEADERGYHLPIVVIAGVTAPRVDGATYYWTTPGGDICHYPAAYQARFGRPIYHASSRRVVVGAAWLGRYRARVHTQHGE